MKLSDFIHTHMETILVEWESFARTLQPAEGQMSVLALRDHAKLILQAVAAGIDVAETPRENSTKSRAAWQPTPWIRTAQRPYTGRCAIPAALRWSS